MCGAVVCSQYLGCRHNKTFHFSVHILSTWRLDRDCSMDIKRKKYVNVQLLLFLTLTVKRVNLEALPYLSELILDGKRIVELQGRLCYLLGRVELHSKDTHDCRIPPRTLEVILPCRRFLVFVHLDEQADTFYQRKVSWETSASPRFEKHDN